MANDEKFAKSIDDEQLDEVAGGTRAKIKKDIKFLNAMGAKLDEKKATPNQVDAAWAEFGIKSTSYSDSGLKNNYSTGYFGGDFKMLNRQDAMIYAMRHAKKVVDLDDYD